MNFFKAEDIFKKYVSQFERTDAKISRKIVHTFGVVKIAEYIAKQLNLSEQDIELAKLIGLLHDIGRFDQAAKFDNFNDSQTMDHAEYGVKILFEDGLIRDFIEEDAYDEIIKKAIYNHNKFEIEEGLSDIELLHSKIIRDADKTDNLSGRANYDFYSLFKATEEEVAKEKITNQVWSEFLSGKTIVASHRITNMDKWLSYIAWVYDYYFDASLKYIRDNRCIDNVVDKLNYKDYETKERMEYARRVVNEYIEKRLK